MTHDEIARLFNTLFENACHIHMHGGFEEPLYLPAHTMGISPNLPEGISEIRYTQDFAASALHEAAHWCIASARRRHRVDYGYWYQPPPRQKQKRAAFFQVERRNQALEKVFSEAAGLPFQVSADDLYLSVAQLREFSAAVDQAATEMLERSLPPRAKAFAVWLSAYRCGNASDLKRFYPNWEEEFEHHV